MRRNQFIYFGVWLAFLALAMGISSALPPLGVGVAVALCLLAASRIAPALSDRPIDLNEPATNPRKPPRWML